MARVILAERKRREIDPTVAVLRECVAELKQPDQQDAAAEERLQAMLDFLETLTVLYEEFYRLPQGAVRKVAKFRGRFRKFLGGGAAH
jgi:DNA-binding transcriptional regulator GbsR (MarR family)